MQSAYRQHHSTDTALIKVGNDPLCSLDERNVVILVLLDMSAAFDTIDHGIMLSEGTNCGFWSQARIGAGPIAVHLVYSTSLWYCTSPRNLHSFIRRLYPTVDPVQPVIKNEYTHSAMMRLLACVVAIQNWMIVNKLKLNADKTVAMFASY